MAAAVTDKKRPNDGHDVQRSKRGWTVWRVMGLCLATLLMLLLIALAYIWSNRYDFAEGVIIDILAEQGIEADLSIRRAGKTGAVIGDIDLRTGGAPVFSAKTITAEYQWRDLLNGDVERLVLDRAVLRITLDAQGKITDGWMPAGSGDGTQIKLPPRGITLKDAQITAVTPFGEIPLRGDINVLSRTAITADLTLAETTVNYKDMTVRVGGPMNIVLKDDDIELETNLRLPQVSLSGGTRIINGATLSGHHKITRGETVSITSTMGARADSITTNRFDAGAAVLSWDGVVGLSAAPMAFETARGTWDASIKDARISDIDMARDLARTLSLSDTLSVTPIAESFAPGLTDMASDLLRGVDIKGAGAVTLSPAEIDLRLSEGLSITSPKTALRVLPDERRALYRFDRDTATAKAQLSLALSGRYPMTLSGLSVDMSTPDGLAIESLNTIKATLRRPNDWRATKDGRDVRLGGSAMTLDYKAGTARILNAVGPIDFDGPLPGGFATTLRTNGQLSVTLSGDSLTADFIPRINTDKAEAPVTVQRFETTTAWRVDDVSFTLAQISEPLFIKRGNNTTTAASLRDLKTMAVQTETDQKLSVSLGEFDAKAVSDGVTQIWDIDVRRARITTDDFIGEGVVMTSPDAFMRATLTPDALPQINLTAATASVITPLFTVQKMPLTLDGTAESFTIDYGKTTPDGKRLGLVKLDGDTLPALPLIGTMTFKDGVYEGTAATVLPKGENTPINVTYRLKDGAGTADVSIPELQFARGGLQPQNFVSALRGKIADVNGTVSANFKLAFAPDKPLQSSGTARLNNLDFGTLPGPFTGVSTELEFSSIFPLETSGAQTLFVDSFNPGIALNDGVIKYELVEGGVKIIDARWPLINGTVSIDPTLWSFLGEKNRVTLRINDVSVGAFLGDIGGGNLSATGDVTGTIPVIIDGVNVLIDGGIVAVENGGVIQYRSPPLVSPVDLIPEKYLTLSEMYKIQQLDENSDPEKNLGKDLAFTALRNFEYQSLSAKLNGPIDGEVELSISFLGRNPKILAGTQFKFNVTIIGELVNLARSLKIDDSFDRLRGYMDISEDEDEGTIRPEPPEGETSPPQ